MVTINRILIKQELLNLIRNSDIISTTVRGVTTITQQFPISEATPTLTLSQNGVKNIRSVDVDGSTTYTAFKDFNILNLNSNSATQIEFTTSISGTNINVQYDYGSGDKIYEDFPQDFVTIKSFPRIGFDIVSSTTTNRSITESLQQKNLVFEFRVLSRSSDVEVLAENLYNTLFTNKRNFQCLNFIRPSGYSSKTPIDNTSNSIYAVVFTFTAPAEFEKV